MGMTIDCISRQAVIDAIAANCIWENEYNLTSYRIKKAVENLPSITPQELILDKIRAEIIEDCGYSKDYVGAFTYSTIKLKTVLQILDKYRAESEVDNGNDD